MWREASKADEKRTDNETPLNPLADGCTGSSRLWSPLVPDCYFGHAMLVVVPRSETDGIFFNLWSVSCCRSYSLCNEKVVPDRCSRLVLALETFVAQIKLYNNVEIDVC